MKNQVKPTVIVVQPKAQEQNVGCCSQFGDNLKVSSCFILKAYSNCIDGCDNTTNSVHAKKTIIDYSNGGQRTVEYSSHDTMSMKECSQCLCLCGAIPLAAQVVLLPFTITGSVVYACSGKSCK